MESRSKPGAYFYAHPATKRTQAEHPGERQGQTELNRAEHGDFRAPWSCRHISSKRPEGPRRRKTEGEAEEPGQLLKAVKTAVKKRKTAVASDTRSKMSGVSPLDVEDFEAICEVSKPVQLMQFRRFDDFRQSFLNLFMI